VPPKTKKASLKQENEVAADNNGTVNPGSGNGWRHKNDVRSATVSFECKTTAKRTFSLKAAELEEAERYALLDAKEMAFVVDIERRRYYIVTQRMWQDMTEATPDSAFGVYMAFTPNKSIRLDRAVLDRQETVALANRWDPAWVRTINGKSYVMVRDYTWHTLRED
jgi:hypothetical protein